MSATIPTSPFWSTDAELPILSDRSHAADFPVDGVLAEFGFDGFETAAAEAVAVAVGDELFLFGGHRDAITLAFEDVTDLTFEGLLAAATVFCFMLAHNINLRPQAGLCPGPW